MTSDERHESSLRETRGAHHTTAATSITTSRSVAQQTPPLYRQQPHCAALASPTKAAYPRKRSA
ncbi:MAG TPA: hypothetical protein VGB85_21390, partial [Nannocystis sp.]